MSTICQALIVATLAAYFILLIGKTGIRENIRNFCDKVKLYKVAEMLECDFCISFWTCLVITIGFWIFGQDSNVLVVFCATPIARFLI